MRYALRFTYEGTYFYGYQVQVNKRTIQEEIEKILSTLFDEPIRIHSSGRTDKGVHALCQVATFDSDKEKEVSRLKRALNALLPKEIYIIDVKVVSSDFHARYSAKKKAYLYIINNGEFNPFLRNYTYFVHKKLDVDKLKNGMKIFLGEHDFRNFCTNKEEDSYLETIASFTLEKRNDYLLFKIIGSGFKRYMVRIIIGSLLAYERDEISLEELQNRLDNKNRNTLCFKAPSEGLYLKEVYYEEKI